MKLKDKVAIVTGAGRGIGREIALLFANEGANIVVNDIAYESAQEVAKEIENMGRVALAIKADVSNSFNVNHMGQRVLEKFNRIDILVNNAGIPLVKPAEEMNEDEWDKVLNVNLKGPFLCSTAVGKIMIKQKSGKIINISSIAGINAFPFRIAYCTSKAGLIMLTKVLAIEWAKYNINVNAIAPGYVKTEMIAELVRKGVINYESLEKRIPMGRLAAMSDIAKTALFLASDESNYINGSVIVVDGGWTAYGYI
ncbi:MAG: glucose 1-dehydrogenase [Nitrososphaerales archaeon]